MSNWFNKKAQTNRVRYSGVIQVDVWVQADADETVERKRAIDALYGTLYEGEANTQDSTPAMVKMNYQSISKSGMR